MDQKSDTKQKTESAKEEIEEKESKQEIEKEGSSQSDELPTLDLKTAIETMKEDTTTPKKRSLDHSLGEWPTIPELKKACRAHGLKVSGTKSELVARLVEKGLTPQDI